MELTKEQKAWLFELVDFVLEVADDPSLDSDDIADRIDGFAASRYEVESLLNTLHDMDWSAHREH